MNSSIKSIVFQFIIRVCLRIIIAIEHRIVHDFD
jgi:hypothetical protein